MTRRCVIIGAAPTKDVAELRPYLRRDDFVVACDGGLSLANALGVTPELIVGDFDSHPRPETDIETIALPCEKDDTDTVFAVREAVRRGFSDFLMLGVTGGRLDHTLGNASLLLWLAARGMKGRIVDEISEYELVSDDYPAKIEGGCRFFSLLAIGGDAEGITIKGAKYPLTDAVITSEYQYGISNEVKSGGTAEVAVKKGRLLLCRVRHE